MKNFAKHVLIEDNHLLLVDKPAGMLVQGDKTGDRPLVDFAKDYIGMKYQKPGAVFMGVIHRLDRPVSGVVAFARTSKALERMNKLFADRAVEKTYIAVVHGRPPLEEDTLINWLQKDKDKNIVKAINKEKKGFLKAELSYRLLGNINDFSLVEIKPKTGRPHQIRVQLAKIGCPIYGDLKYGAKEAMKDGSICLHSRSLAFEHPVKKEPIRAEAFLPKAFPWDLFGLTK